MRYLIGFGRASGFPYLICPDGLQIILRSGYGNGYLYEVGAKFMFTHGASDFRELKIGDFTNIREDAFKNEKSKEHLRRAFLQVIEDLKCRMQLV